MIWSADSTVPAHGARAVAPTLKRLKLRQRSATVKLAARWAAVLLFIGWLLLSGIVGLAHL